MVRMAKRRRRRGGGRKKQKAEMHGKGVYMVYVHLLSGQSQLPVPLPERTPPDQPHRSHRDWRPSSLSGRRWRQKTQTQQLYSSPSTAGASAPLRIDFSIPACAFIHTARWKKMKHPRERTDEKQKGNNQEKRSVSRSKRARFN